MITSILQVNEQFFKYLYEVGSKASTLVRYAKLSSHDYVEEKDNQTYPCIAIQEYTPKLSEEWFVDYHKYFDGISEDNLTGFLFDRPVLLDFRFDVSIASKAFGEYTALKDLFLIESLKSNLIFNKQLSGEDTVGDLIRFSVIPTDIPRVDGVRETNYEYTLKVWLYCREPEQVDLVQQIILDLQQKNISYGEE